LHCIDTNLAEIDQVLKRWGSEICCLNRSKVSDCKASKEIKLIQLRGLRGKLYGSIISSAITGGREGKSVLSEDFKSNVFKEIFVFG
jgi:hypothetical protein